MNEGKNNIQQLLQEYDIETAEDIQDGVDESKAFGYAEQIRKGLWSRGNYGHHVSVYDLFEKVGIPDWYHWSCNQIAYLFPRAHCITYAKLTWRLAWYKLNYPDTFKVIADKHYKNMKEEQKNIFN